jgi:hypothetical protein
LLNTYLVELAISLFAETPAPPYYAVVFTSTRTGGDHGYSSMVNKMVIMLILRRYAPNLLKPLFGENIGQLP